MKLHLILAVCLATLTGGGPVTLAWDANAPEQKITSYVVEYGPTAALEQRLTVTAPTATTPDLPPGTYHFAVRAVNAQGSSALSAVVTHTLPPAATAPAGLRVVEIQTSSNLQDWRTIAMIPQTPGEPAAEFVRARLNTLPQ